MLSVKILIGVLAAGVPGLRGLPFSRPRCVSLRRRALTALSNAGEFGPAEGLGDLPGMVDSYRPCLGECVDSFLAEVARKRLEALPI